MGNETSSVKIHSLLTAEDIKGLRAGFPGGGNGPPPAHLDWGHWTCWPAEEKAGLEKIMSTEVGHITFHSYQEVSGNVIRGQSDARVKFLFRLLDRPVDKTITSTDLFQLITHLVDTAVQLILGEDHAQPDIGVQTRETSRVLAESLMHELVFPKDSPKSSLHRKFSEDLYLDFDMVERWLVMKCPLVDEILLFTLAKSFGIPVNSSAG